MKLMSCVILKWPEGYTADIRFANKSYDVILSSNNHYMMWVQIEKYMRNKL